VLSVTGSRCDESGGGATAPGFGFASVLARAGGAFFVARAIF
jgi:hypothetical protein